MRSAVPDEDGEDGGTPENGASAAPDTADGERPPHQINGHQTKHTWPPDREFVPGQDFMPDGRSAFRPEENPPSLADDVAGTGERIGSRERVDAGRVIGTYRNEKTGEVAPTTRITIHHKNNGTVHVVPAPPRSPQQCSPQQCSPQQ